MSATETLCNLLANCAQCHLALGKYIGAVHLASTAVLMKPEHAKAQYRRALGLLNLDHITAALAACKQGLSKCPNERSLLDLEVRVTSASKVRRSETKPVGGASSAGKLPTIKPEDLQNAAALSDGEKSTVEQVALLNNMTEMALKSGKVPAGLKNALDTRVSPFHTEFSKSGLFPPGCDAKKASRVLWSAYESNRCGIGGESRLGINSLTSKISKFPEVSTSLPRVGYPPGSPEMRVP